MLKSLVSACLGKERSASFGFHGPIRLIRGAGLLSLAVFTSSTASATDLVLYSGDNATLAMEEVVRLTDRTFEQLYPMTVSDLIAGRTPILQGKGQLYLCYGPPTSLASTEAVMTRVQEAIQYNELDQATEMLRTAVATLGCLVEPLEPSIGAVPYLYRGYLEILSERDDLARASFRQAKLYSPDLPWDYLLTSGKDTYESVSVSNDVEQLASLEVLPPPAVGALHINGEVIDERNGPISIPAGIHLVQVAMPQMLTMTVELQPGDQARLVIPSAVPSDGVNWAANENLRPALGAVFRASVQPDISVFVVGDKSVWEFDVSEAKWTDTAVAAEAFQRSMDQSAQAARRPKELATYSLIGTAGITVVAAALLGASGGKTAKMKQSDSDYEAALLVNDNDAAITAYNDLNRYRASGAGLRAAGIVTLALAGGGGAYAVVNFKLGHSRRRALPPENPYALDVAKASEDSGTAPVKSED